MNAPGPLALVGGGEHRSGCEPIDRRLMDEVGVSRPRVAVVPVASTRRQLPLAASLARSYWTRLGAEVAIALPDRGASRRGLELMSEADIVVLTGGYPDRLVGSLGASALLDVIIQRWRQGAGVAASSAGAMALFEWRLRLYPPNPFGLMPGLGLLYGYLVAPHFDRFRAQRWGGRVTHTLGGLGVLGLDESTALVGRNGQYQVLGRNAVTILSPGGRALVYPRGACLALDLPSAYRPALRPVALHSPALLEVVGA
jgi:cyanophycinase